MPVFVLSVTQQFKIIHFLEDFSCGERCQLFNIGLPGCQQSGDDAAACLAYHIAVCARYLSD